MSFADSILTEELEPLRQRLLYHPLWTGIEDGTVQRDTLRVFALQDWWMRKGAEGTPVAFFLLQQSFEDIDRIADRAGNHQPSQAGESGTSHASSAWATACSSVSSCP